MEYAALPTAEIAVDEERACFWRQVIEHRAPIPVAFGTLGIRALHQRIASASACDRALRVVDDDALRDSGNPLEGAAVAAEPGHHRLVEHEFDVLVPREAQRHHAAPGSPLLAAGWIEQ